MIDQVLWTRALAIVIGSSVYSFTLILLAFLVGLGRAAPRSSRVLTARTTRPIEWLGRRAPRHRRDDRPVVPRHGQAACRLPRPFARRRLLRRRHHLLPVPARRARRLARDAVHGRRPAAHHSRRRALARVGRARRRHRLLGQHARRDPRLVRRRLRRPAHRSASSAGSGIGAVRHGRARARRCSSPARADAKRFIAAALLPAVALAACTCCRAGASPLLGRACSASRSPRTSSRRNKWALPELEYYHDGIATTVSVEKLAARPSRSRTTARSTPRTATTWRRRSWSASCRSRFIRTALDQASRASRSSASAPASPSARSRSSPSATPTSSSSSRRWSRRARRFFGPYNHHPEQDPRVRIIIGDGRNFLDASRRQVRRHRLRAVEPVDHRRVEPVHRRLLEAGARAARRRRRLLPVGAALRDVVEEHQDASSQRSPRCSPTPTSSRPRICRATSILVATNHPLPSSTCTRSARELQEPRR